VATTKSVPPASGTVPLARGALPGAGHLWQLLSDPTGFLASLPARGDLVEIRLGRRRTYVVCSPELVAQVLLTGHRDFDKRGPFFDNVAAFFGDGLATCPNAKQARLRRLTQPAFQPGKLPGYAQLAGRDVAAITQGWREGQVLDVYRVTQELAMRITASTMFASRFAGTGTDAAPETLRQVDTLVRGAFVRMVAPGVTRLPLAASRFERARLGLCAKIDETIAAYRRDGWDQGDLLSMFLAEDGDGAALSDTEVRDQVMTMFIAGISTTAAEMAWVLHYLSLDDRLDAAAAAEARRACGAAAGYQHPAELPTLADVITETFRIRPAAWMFSRTTVASTVLGGHRLPAGADILISPYILHHRPDLFPDPERFDPGRWSGHQQSWAKAERALTMIPFGTGSRKCIAHDFSVMNITLAVASILTTWKLTPAGRRPATIRGRSVIEPRGLIMRLHRRPLADPHEAPGR
jgi:cytochrome P450